MKKRILAGLLCLLCLAGAVSLAETMGPVQRFPSREFTYYDLDGTAYKASDLIGKPAIINFLASWCPPCKAELPFFRDAYEEYGNDIAFLFVDMCGGGGDRPQDMIALFEKESYLMPLYFDTDGEAAAVYEVSAIPTTVFIDEKGYITDLHVGAMMADSLQEEIQMLLAD